MHAQIIDLPILTPSDLEEGLYGKISISALHDAWADNSFIIGPLYPFFKRIIEVLLIIFFSPIILVLFFIVSALIFITMGSPVFFKQVRVGRAGKSFLLYKFRTMLNSSDRLTETLDKDPRITRLGYFLRKFRLDELPQIYNVLKGNMSLIGPRPERDDLTQKYSREIPIYNIRNVVRPGITGWAQVMQGYANGVDGAIEKLRYDLFYVKHFSFWLDVKIFFRTMYTVIFQLGAK